MEARQQYKSKSVPEWEKSIEDEIKRHLATAQLSNIQIENLSDVNKPFAISYHVVASGYGQQTGKRIFVQPAYFQYGQSAIFTANERKYPLYFHYPWLEQDEVILTLPDGYRLDSANQLLDAKPTVLGGTSEYKCSVSVVNDGRAIKYIRSFVFDGGGKTFFSSYRYPEFKSYFDSLRQQDNNAIALERM
jgi:hypothetical protein